MIVSATACGSAADVDETATVDGAHVQSGSTTSQVPSATETSDAGPGADQQALGEADAEDAVPTYPPPALPIKNAWEFDHALYSLIGVNGDVFAFAEGSVVRLDPDTGAIDRVTTIAAAEYRNSPLGGFASGDQLLMSSATRDNNVDHVVSVNAESLEITGRLHNDAGVVSVALSPGPSEGRTAFIRDNQLLSVDAKTLTDEIIIYEDFDQSLASFQASTDFWTFAPTGEVEVTDLADGRRLDQFSVDYGSMLTDVSVMAKTGDVLWIGDLPAGTIWPLDTKNREVGEPISLGEYFEGRITRLRFSSPEHSYLGASVIDDGVETLVLVSLDEQGIVWSRTISPMAESFHNILTAANTFAVADDRLFVRDHLRRIVEVDLERIGETEPWQPSGLPIGPTLSGVEAEVAAVAERVVAGDDVGSTDPEITDQAAAVFSSVFPNTTVTGVLIEPGGDRAHVELQRGNEFPVLLVFDLVDGEWLPSARLACYFLQLGHCEDVG